MTISKEEREELLVLYNNAAQNLSELKKHSYLILVSSSALLGFVFINVKTFNDLCGREFLFFSLAFGLIMSVFLYWRSREAFIKHRDRIKRIKSKFSPAFQECYGEGPGPGCVVDGFYLIGGIFYLVLIFIALFLSLESM